LQQAIKLLQLSNIELSAFVEEQLEKNPLLERGTGDENRRGEAVETALETQTVSTDTVSTGAALSDMDTPDHALAPESTAADVGGSIDWSRNNSGGSFSGSGDYDPMVNSAADVTLSEHIQSQMALLKFSDKDRLVANYLAGQVDDAGYLRMSVEEASDNLGIGPARVSSVLLQLQTLEPTGLFATSLCQCLALQLREMDALDAPMQTLLDNLDLLAKHDLSKLSKLCGVKLDQLKGMTAALRKLSPKPGLAFGGRMASVVEPDVFIRETPHGGWSVELNADTLPRVLVNKRYYNEIKQAGGDNDAARSFISECHADANWLVKSLDQRARSAQRLSNSKTAFSLSGLII